MQNLVIAGRMDFPRGIGSKADGKLYLQKGEFTKQKCGVYCDFDALNYP
jgi:hypothetical protein